MTLNSLDQYGSSFQIKVISTLLTHKEFLININDILDPEYFSSKAHKWIIETILKYYEKYHCNISMEILKVEVKKIENEILQIAIKEQLRLAYEASEEDLKYVQEEFSNFCKNQQLKKALLGSVDLLNAGDYDSIRTLVDNALKAGQDKNLGHEYEKDVEARYREDHRVTIPTPWDIFNELLQGGLGGGDLGLFFGNPGGGKSWALVALGGFAIKLGYNVLHYTLELGEAYVARRYDSFFTHIPVQTITEHKTQVEDMVKNLPGKLIIKEFPTGRVTLSSIESHITKSQELDFKPDLIIIDYLDLLTTKRKYNDKKEAIDDVYTAAKGLAKFLNLPIWSVSQINRMGAKDNVVEGEKVAGSYDKMMISDFCVSLSRKKEDKVNGTGRFHIMKNRYGMDGMTYKGKIDTSIGSFEILDQYYGDEDAEYESPSNTNFKDYSMLENSEKKKLQENFKGFFELKD